MNPRIAWLLALSIAIGVNTRVASAPTPAARIIDAMHLVTIPPATFRMGSATPSDILDGAPQHTVHLPGFRIAAFDVTFDDYDSFARATHRALPDDQGWGRGNRPVIKVTWADTQAFITWLNRGTGRHLRLPSEA
jgi:formylglycine-generating enzyme required for sulfatase activity